jgi:solute:Na+ symporter, SSS family
VAEKLCGPGVFGLVMAALTAALMSTIDTLINAVSVVSVNDVYRPYIAKNRSDQHYLRVARIVCLATAGIGILLVPLFASFKSIYVAHGAFIASVTPPMAVAVLFGAFSKRYTPAAAFWTMLGGSIAIALSIAFPVLITPLSHSIDPAGGFKYMRALYGMVASGIIGILVTLLTKPKPLSEIEGLVIGTLDRAKEKFKGGPINDEEGISVVGNLKPVSGEHVLALSSAMMEKLKARVGDLLYVSDSRRWLGGLRSVHAKVGSPHTEGSSTIHLSDDLIVTAGLLPERTLRVEKIL